MVDADTDYDHDGKIAEHERGAALGDEYKVADEGLDRALRGQANFDFEPITDQWGTWVGAWAPIYDAAGKVEAVLGVDYDAREWFAAIAAARRERILQLGFFLATIAAAGWAIGALRADLGPAASDRGESAPGAGTLEADRRADAARLHRMERARRDHRVESRRRNASSASPRRRCSGSRALDCIVPPPSVRKSTAL